MNSIYKNYEFEKVSNSYIMSSIGNKPRHGPSKPSKEPKGKNWAVNVIKKILAAKFMGKIICGSNPYAGLQDQS